MIRKQRVSITTAGAAGSATGSGETGVMTGRLVAVHIDYTTQPATTDIVVATKTAPITTLLTITSANTDGWFYPRVLLADTSGAPLTAVYDAAPVNDHITVAVAQGDAVNNGVIVTVLVEE